MFKKLVMPALFAALAASSAFADCKTFHDVKTFVDAKRGDVSTWKPLTFANVSLLKSVKHDIDPDVVEGWVGHTPNPGSPAFVFLFKSDGCLDDSFSLSDDNLDAALAGAPL